MDRWYGPMKPRTETATAPVIVGAARGWAWWRGLPPSQRGRIGRLAAYLGLVTSLFAQPLGRLFSVASQNGLSSYIPLVPLIVGYLLCVERPDLTHQDRPSVLWGLLLAAAGAAAAIAAIALDGSLSANDGLSLLTLAYVTLVAAGGFAFLGARWMASAAFPMAFLAFMIPLPDAFVNRLETLLVLGSAEAAAFLFQLTGTVLIRHGTIFELPGIVLRVGQECSGIRSTWVLFMTSLVASHLFLRSSWRRFVLVVFIVPLSIVRNGFRILVIGLLCVHVGPHMIDSVIHTRGGPIFFLLSLVPLYLLLVCLRRGERQTANPR
jgi:exosortase C (VPDSG-CTERM-specific)